MLPSPIIFNRWSAEGSLSSLGLTSDLNVLEKGMV